MYADTYSDSMLEAINETKRRREKQMAYNEEYGIIPMTIKKEIRPPLHNSEDESATIIKDASKKSRSELQRLIADTEKQMKAAAKEYDFERAAKLRDIMFELKAELDN
jgi:excinuclease ABC subunit B